MNYLDFEEPILQLREQLTQAQELQETSDVDMANLVEDLESKIREVTANIYSDLTPWQRVQVSRAGGRLSATVGSRALANVSIGDPGPPGGNFTLRVMLSHYFVASVDDFSLEALSAT